jgi:hypothetical protein
VHAPRTEATKVSIVLWLGFTFTTFHHTLWAHRSQVAMFINLGSELLGAAVCGFVLASASASI